MLQILPGTSLDRLHDELYLTGSRRNALEMLLQGVRGGDSLLLLTGVSGVGKSAVLHAMIAALADEPVRIIHLSNIFELAREHGALRWGLRVLIHQIIDRDPTDTLADGEVEAALAALMSAPGGENQIVVAVDDADSLTPQALEYLLLTTSLTRQHRPMLQLVLAGSDGPWAQRLVGAAAGITAGVHVILDPLTDTEIADYVAFSLRRSGHSIANVDLTGVVEEIVERSGGLPAEIDRMLGVAIARAECRNQLPQIKDPVLPIVTADRPLSATCDIGAPVVPTVQFPATGTQLALQTTDAWERLRSPSSKSTSGWRRSIRAAVFALTATAVASIALLHIESEARDTDSLVRSWLNIPANRPTAVADQSDTKSEAKALPLPGLVATPALAEKEQSPPYSAPPTDGPASDRPEHQQPTAPEVRPPVAQALPAPQAPPTALPAPAESKGQASAAVEEHAKSAGGYAVVSRAVVSEKPRPEMVSVLLHRADELLRQGDIVSARMLFEQAAAAGSGAGAIGMAKTYDPAFLASINAVGVRGDLNRALDWYRKAIALGDSEATERLKSLGAASR